MPAPYPRKPPEGILALHNALRNATGVEPPPTDVMKDYSLGGSFQDVVTNLLPVDENADFDPSYFLPIRRILGGAASGAMQAMPAWMGPPKAKNITDAITKLINNPEIKSNAHAALELAKARYPGLMSVPDKISVMKDTLFGRFNQGSGRGTRARGTEIEMSELADDTSIKSYFEDLAQSAINARYMKTGKLPYAQAEQIKKEAGKQMDLLQGYITPKDVKPIDLNDPVTRENFQGVIQDALLKNWKQGRDFYKTGSFPGSEQAIKEMDSITRGRLNRAAQYLNPVKNEFEEEYYKTNPLKIIDLVTDMPYLTDYLKQAKYTSMTNSAQNMEPTSLLPKTLEEALTRIGVPNIKEPVIPWYKKPSDDPDVDKIIDDFDKWIK